MGGGILHLLVRGKGRGGERGGKKGGDWRERDTGWEGKRGRERWREEEGRDGNEGVVIVEERGRRANQKEGGGKGRVRRGGAEFKNWGMGVCSFMGFLGREETKKNTIKIILSFLSFFLCSALYPSYQGRVAEYNTE